MAKTQRPNSFQMASASPATGKARAEISKPFGPRGGRSPSSGAAQEHGEQGGVFRLAGDDEDIGELAGHRIRPETEALGMQRGEIGKQRVVIAGDAHGHGGEGFHRETASSARRRECPVRSPARLDAGGAVQGELAIGLGRSRFPSRIRRGREARCSVDLLTG